MKLHIVSHPEYFNGEEQIICRLLELPNVMFHLRKPKADLLSFDTFINNMPSPFHRKIILHDAHDLIDKYNLGGLHFSTTKRAKASNYIGKVTLSTSCHSMEEIKTLAPHFNACFLSPIFPSISKKGYQADFDLDAVEAFVKSKNNIKVIALGGIDAGKVSRVQTMGFAGAAVLGSVWGDDPKADGPILERVEKLLQPIERPYCLSIAGFDPSAGAGVLSDIKTFESNNCYGFGVSTALTYQNDNSFVGMQWTPKTLIIKQLEPLKKYPIHAIKIGLIENFELLEELVNWCSIHFAKAIIIWDPILKASAGFDFHNNNHIPQSLLDKINLITPNAEEYDQLNLAKAKNKNGILLKGGHRETKQGVDTLILKESSVDINGETYQKKTDKHGTGCVLSSAIAANLAMGNDLLSSCQRAKQYVEAFILSNPNRLGYHA